MCFKMGSRSPVTFKTKLSVTAFNNSFQLFSKIFVTKSSVSKILHKVLTEYGNMIHKNSKMYWGTLMIECNHGKI